MKGEPWLRGGLLAERRHIRDLMISAALCRDAATPMLILPRRLQVSEVTAADNRLPGTRGNNESREASGVRARCAAFVHSPACRATMGHKSKEAHEIPGTSKRAPKFVAQPAAGWRVIQGRRLWEALRGARLEPRPSPPSPTALRAPAGPARRSFRMPPPCWARNVCRLGMPLRAAHAQRRTSHGIDPGRAAHPPKSPPRSAST